MKKIYHLEIFKPNKITVLTKSGEENLIENPIFETGGVGPEEISRVLSIAARATENDKSCVILGKNAALYIAELLEELTCTAKG